jgi:hypothetical protein
MWQARRSVSDIVVVVGGVDGVSGEVSIRCEACLGREGFFKPPRVVRFRCLVGRVSVVMCGVVEGGEGRLERLLVSDMVWVEV